MMFKRGLCVVAIIVAGLAATPARAAPEPEAVGAAAAAVPDGLPDSAEALRVEYGNTAATAKHDAADLAHLEKYTTQLGEILATVISTSYEPAKDLDEMIRRAKAAHETLVAAFADPSQPPPDAATTELNGLLSQLLNQPSRLFDAVNEFESLSWSEQDPRASALVSTITAAGYDTESTATPNPTLQALQDYWATIPYDLSEQASVERLKLAAAAATTAMGALNGSMFQDAFATEKVAVQQRVTRMRDTAARLQRETKTRSDAAATRLQAIDAKLAELKVSEREAASAKTTGIEKLFVAVYWMLAVLVVLFVTTIIARAKTGKDVIEDRTLVEFAGMSFLLLTIIILASVQLIAMETLGTLLGTMAGYVFGKSTQK